MRFMLSTLSSKVLDAMNGAFIYIYITTIQYLSVLKTKIYEN